MFRADHTARTGAVFHHHGLAQNIAGGFGDDATHNVV
jgi:hypothetical protein